MVLFNAGGSQLGFMVYEELNSNGISTYIMGFLKEFYVLLVKISEFYVHFGILQGILRTILNFSYILWIFWNFLAWNFPKIDEIFYEKSCEPPDGGIYQIDRL